MLLLIILYLAIGLTVECAMFTLNPDWTDGETWRHLVLWPSYMAWPTLPHINWRNVTLAALLLFPLSGLWLTRRLRQQGARRKRVSVDYAVNPPDKP